MPLNQERCYKPRKRNDRRSGRKGGMKGTLFDRKKGKVKRGAELVEEGDMKSIYVNQLGYLGKLSIYLLHTFAFTSAYRTQRDIWITQRPD